MAAAGGNFRNKLKRITAGEGVEGFVGGNFRSKLMGITAGERVEGVVGGNAAKDASQQYHRQRRDRHCGR